MLNKTFWIGIALLILFGCRPLEVEVDDACLIIDTTQQENLLCILGDDRLCLCPSSDISVQARCDLGNLPERTHPEPLCEEN